MGRLRHPAVPNAFGRGLIAAEEAGRVHRRVVERLEEAGVRLAGAYYCPHTPEAGCSCRKPAPELILRAARDLDLDLAGSFTVGDKPRDLEAGRAAGTRAVRFEGDWHPVLAEITAAVLGAFAGKQVLVAGDVMLDEYIWGEVWRISPEAPVPVVETARRTYVLGGAGNVAANVVSLGGRALLVGVVGRDPQADLLREALERCGISAQGLLVDDTRPTTTKTRVVAHRRAHPGRGPHGLRCHRRGRHGGWHPGPGARRRPTPGSRRPPRQPRRRHRSGQSRHRDGYAGRAAGGAALTGRRFRSVSLFD